MLTVERVSRVLAMLWKYGAPRAITVDNGPELSSCARNCWTHQGVVDLHFIQPGKPTQNGNFVAELPRRFASLPAASRATPAVNTPRRMLELRRPTFEN